MRYAARVVRAVRQGSPILEAPPDGVPRKVILPTLLQQTSSDVRTIIAVGQGTQTEETSQAPRTQQQVAGDGLLRSSIRVPIGHTTTPMSGERYGMAVSHIQTGGTAILAGACLPKLAPPAVKRAVHKKTDV